MAGDAHAAQTQATRVGVAQRMNGRGIQRGPCLLVQRVVGALGLPGHLAVGEYHILGVLNVWNTAAGCQLGGRGASVHVAGDQLALGAVDVVEEMLAKLRLRGGELAQLRCGGVLRCAGHIQVKIAVLAEGGCLMLLLVLVLLWLVQLMHMNTNADAAVLVLVIGEVRKTLLYCVQIARADCALQNLAPVLLRQTLDVGPHCGITVGR